MFSENLVYTRYQAVHIDGDFFDGAEVVGDECILYFDDGPHLLLYKIPRNNKYYLFYKIDDDVRTYISRWLVTSDHESDKLLLQDVIDFMKGNLGLQELFTKRTRDIFILENNKDQNCIMKLSKWELVPQYYLPSAFFKIEPLEASIDYVKKLENIIKRIKP